MISKEAQRYGRDKNTTINHQYIESGAYRKRFDKISSDIKLNRVIYSIAKEMLIHRSGTRYEDMYWIDRISLKILCCITDSKVEERILYTKHVKRIIKKNKGLLTIHSHPSSLPPSIEDFNSAYFNKYCFGIVCGHNGSVYIYSSDEYIPKGIYYYLAGSFYKKCSNEREAQILALTELCKSYKIYFREVI